MPLRGGARLKSTLKVEDFDHFGWWKALVKAGVSPPDAWAMDFIETTYVLDIEPSFTDISLALYHQRKQNGATD
jgi:hypothetical protein|tara:strand:- start:297 stop:518 length:222 start_codon:yes stop_codon:yes gene_type:complete